MAFEAWYKKHREVVNERIHDRQIKGKMSPYIRSKFCSAYLIVRLNIALLWIFQAYPHLELPKTNNELEGIFSDIKPNCECIVTYVENIEKNH